MTMMRKLAAPSMATVALLAGMSFAMAQGAGGAAGGPSGGTADTPAADSNPADAGTAAKPMMKHKKHKSAKATHRAKSQSMSKNGKPLGPTNTRS